MSANLNKIDQTPVDRVAMPLVRLLRNGNLSWSNKVKVADAIADILRHKKGMDDEAAGRQLAGMVAQAQAGGAKP